MDKKIFLIESVVLSSSAIVAILIAQYMAVEERVAIKMVWGLLSMLGIWMILKLFNILPRFKTSGFRIKSVVEMLVVYSLLYNSRYNEPTKLLSVVYTATILIESAICSYRLNFSDDSDTKSSEFEGRSLTK